MRKGLVAYDDETILLNQEVLADLAKTAYGIPLVVEHPDIPIDESTIGQIPIVGRVSCMEYNLATDEWEAEFVVETQAAVDLLQKGHGVSTGWYGIKYGPGGTMNNVPYGKELLQGRYEHLAIVANPRYEMAFNPIFLNSKEDGCKTIEQAANINTNQSTPGRRKTMFNLFRNKREEIKVNEGDTMMVNMDDGESKSLNELVDEYKKKKEASKPEEKKMLNDDDMVEVDGEQMSIKELKAKLKGDCKEAAKEPEGFKEEDKGDKEGVAKSVGEQNEAEPEAKENEKEDEEDKKTNANFKKLKDKHTNSAAPVEQDFVSTRERVEMGRLRYGSAKK
jgi:hypothetical protein